MKTTYDPEDDTLCMRFRDKPIAREVSHGWNIQAYAADGDLDGSWIRDGKAA